MITLPAFIPAPAVPILSNSHAASSVAGVSAWREAIQ